MSLSLKYANLALAFALELCVLAALGYWGFRTGEGALMKVVLGVGAPLLAAVVWGIFGSPNAPIKAVGPWRIALVLVWFGVAAVALALVGQPKLALIFALLFTLNHVLLYVWRQ